MIDHSGWTPCDSPDCLLCATKSPRRNVPAEPDPSPSWVDAYSSDPRLPLGRAVDFPPTTQLADLIKKYSRPLPPPPDLRSIFDSRVDHIHWAFDGGPGVRPARLSRLARLARLQPIRWVRDHVSAQWDWHRWLVGVTPLAGGFVVHLACLALIFERNRPARLH